MSLKNKDGSLRHEPTCFERDSRAVGINFELSDRTQLFAPYAFMSHVQLNREEEIVFHYPFGMVLVDGLRLKRIYDVVKTQELLLIKRSNRDEQVADMPRVTEVRYKASMAEIM